MTPALWGLAAGLCVAGAGAAAWAWREVGRLFDSWEASENE